MSTLIPFQFQSNEIRVVTDENGEPLFVAKDVATALGYSNPRKAVRDHCKKSIQAGGTLRSSLDQQTILIPESDLYRMTLKSQLESAEAFQDWIVEEVLPTIRKTGRYEAPKAEQPQPKLISETARAMMSMAKAFGFKGNQAALCADRATRQLIGESPLALLGAELVSTVKEQLLTATDIGKQINKSGRAINVALEKMGLMKHHYNAKGDIQWDLTDRGQQYAEMLDVGKKHGDGTPIKQIKWQSGVVDMVKAHIEGAV